MRRLTWLPQFRGTGIEGVHGGGALGPPEVDGRAMTAGSEYGTGPAPFCNHTGQDYWPRPCDRCLRQSAEGQRVAR